MVSYIFLTHGLLRKSIPVFVKKINIEVSLNNFIFKAPLMQQL